MNDYIKREDTLNALREYPVTKLKTAIRRLPSADVLAVRHGRWIEEKIQNHVEKTYHCSECDYQAWGENEKTHYCGNCGAKMDGERDE